MSAAVEQAMLALRAEVEWIDTQLARMGDERSRLIAALDLLEGPVGDSPARPASGNALTCPEPGCGRTFTSRIGLGVQAQKAHHRPAAKVPAGELERTPANPPLDNRDRGHSGGPEFDTAQTSGPDGESDLPGGATPAAVSTDLAAVLALLDHPEWVDGAVQNGWNGAWIREDGDLWRCSCGRAVRNLSQLRSHMGSVVNPESHRPDITGNGARSNAQPAAEKAAAAREPEAQPARNNARTRETQPVDTGLPYGCSCTSRFPTGRDWSAHVKAQPTKERNKHRLTDQPPARIVPTGLPAPRPAVEPLKPAVAALQDRQTVFHHRGGDSIVAGASVIA